jgi:toluene monooxygenase system protein D
MTVLEMDSDAETAQDLVGPVIRAGDLAEAVIDAVAADNPGRDVLVLDRDDYVRIHTTGQCRLTLASLERSLGHRYQLAALEIDMPSFKGRLKTHTDEYLWFYATGATPAEGGNYA